MGNVVVEKWREAYEHWPLARQALSLAMQMAQELFEECERLNTELATAQAQAITEQIRLEAQGADVALGRAAEAMPRGSTLRNSHLVMPDKGKQWNYHRDGDGDHVAMGATAREALAKAEEVTT